MVEKNTNTNYMECTNCNSYYLTECNVFFVTVVEILLHMGSEIYCICGYMNDLKMKIV